MSLICSKSMSDMPWLSNEIQICGKICYFSGIINDCSEYIVLIFTVDRHFVFFVVSQEAGRGFLGTFGR